MCNEWYEAARDDDRLLKSIQQRERILGEV